MTTRLSRRFGLGTLLGAALLLPGSAPAEHHEEAAERTGMNEGDAGTHATGPRSLADEGCSLLVQVRHRGVDVVYL